MNVYNGIAVADTNGEAWIDLPTYFASLNVEPRYQLTPVGAPASLYVKTELGANTNRFQVAGGSPGLRISWQVTGIRNDAWARANRIQPEIAKVASERGKYLTPELFGEAAALRMVSDEQPPPPQARPRANP